MRAQVQNLEMVVCACNAREHVDSLVSQYSLEDNPTQASERNGGETQGEKHLWNDTQVCPLSSADQPI